MLTRVCVRFACLSSLFLLGSCGGGAGVLPPTIDLTGYWQLYLTPTGSADESGPSAVFLNQTGALVDGAAMNGTVSANTFSITSTAGSVFTMYFDGALVGNTALGTLVMTGMINATGTFRLVRFTPLGTMTSTGTLDGIAVNMSTNAAVGSRIYTDTGLSVLELVEITAAYGSEHLDITFDAAGLAVGALGVPGTVAATVTYRDDVNMIELDADGGTLTVTAYDANGFTGSYSLTLPGGGTLTGTFDVIWDIEAYDP